MDRMVCVHAPENGFTKQTKEGNIWAASCHRISGKQEKIPEKSA